MLTLNAAYVVCRCPWLKTLIFYVNKCDKIGLSYIKKTDCLNHALNYICHSVIANRSLKKILVTSEKQILRTQTGQQTFLKQ